ncbi:MAG: DMT family transporter, partial [Candidatus Thorarchaeota archaeon]
IILGAMCMWGFYSSIGKEAMKTMTPLEMNAGSVVFGAIFFGVFALSEQPWNLPVISDFVFLFNVLFLAVGVTVVGFYLYFAGIDKLGATKAGGFVNFVPVFGTILSMLILSETIYWTFLVGLLLVITGVSIINLPNKNSNSEIKMKVE